LRARARAWFCLLLTLFVFSLLLPKRLVLRFRAGEETL
jgi:hypothetical protein